MDADSRDRLEQLLELQKLVSSLAPAGRQGRAGQGWGTGLAASTADAGMYGLLNILGPITSHDAKGTKMLLHEVSLPLVSGGCFSVQ